MNSELPDDSASAEKNVRNNHSSRQFAVPKVDKNTGQLIPEWKQKLLLTKIQKKFDEEDAKKIAISNGVPEWKKEVLARKEHKLMVSEDPLLIRKRKIRAIKEEYTSVETPPWKKELLKKRIDQIQQEIKQIEMEMMKNKDENHELFNAKTFKEENQ